ncbi:MAG TPA: hypothetical protein VF585_04825 [Chthoniobacterales bacterium]|jgi:hypothetical protein
MGHLNPFNRSRILLGLFVFSLFVFTLASTSSRTIHKIWQLGTAGYSMWPPFADLRPILISCDVYRNSGWNWSWEAIKIHSETIGIPTYNYPTAWLTLAHLGLGESDLRWMGSLFCFSFCICFFLLFRNFPLPHLFGVLGMAISPPVLLAVERGNSDLLIFSLVFCCVYLFANAKSVPGRMIAQICLLLPAALKLYPIFAVVTLASDRKRWFIASAILLVSLFGGYALSVREELRQIRSNTPKTTDIGYGSQVLSGFLIKKLDADSRNTSQQSFEAPLRKVINAFPYVGIAVCLAVGLVLGRQLAKVRSEGVPLDATGNAMFQCGAAIYMGTFLLGNNFAYRLIFLFFCFPHLYCLVRHSAELRTITTALLLTMGAAFWLTMVDERMEYRLLGQASHWLIFAGILGFFARSFFRGLGFASAPAQSKI